MHMELSCIQASGDDPKQEHHYRDDRFGVVPSGSTCATAGSAIKRVP